LNQFGGALRRAQNHFRIDTTLEAVTRVGRQIQVACSSSNARRQKVSRFEQNAVRGIGHPCFLAAHDAADPNRALLIGNDEIVRLERVSLSIQREKLFAIACEPHVDVAF
jgi:hypothetical protein